MFYTRRHFRYWTALLLCGLESLGCSGTSGGASPIGGSASTAVGVGGSTTSSNSAAIGQGGKASTTPSTGGTSARASAGASGSNFPPIAGGRDGGQGGNSTALVTGLGGQFSSAGMTSRGGNTSLGGSSIGSGGISMAKGGAAGAGNAATGGNSSLGSGGSSVAKGGTAGAGNIATGGTISTAGSSSTPNSAICTSSASYPSPTLGSATRVVNGSGNGLYEGTVWVASRGTLFFSDINFDSQPNPSTLRVLTPPSSVQVLLNPSGTNGLAMAPNGMLIGAAHDVQGLVSIDPSSGNRSVLITKYQGKSFNSPNDVTVRSDGTIYFTDPDFQLGGRAAQLGFMGVFRVSADGQSVALVDDTLTQPNGIALSPDEKTLYVANTNGNQVVRYAVAADGSTGPKQDFVTITGPDGVGIDCAGNLYVASHSAGVVSVFAPTGGSAITSTAVAAKTTNIAFGGADRKTLYVSAGKSIYSIAGNIPGYPN